MPRWPQVGVLDRFLAKVDASAGPDGCHTWTASTTKRGYGQFGVSNPRRKVYAHRWALEHSLGRPLAADESALHRCDNPPCVNPLHLYAGTQADNMQDCTRRGRLVNPIAEAKRAQTHCAKGHEFTPENTYIKSSGHRQCRTCRAAGWGDRR